MGPCPLHFETHTARIIGPLCCARTKISSGAPLRPEDASVATAFWGSADPSEGSARDAASIISGCVSGIPHRTTLPASFKTHTAVRLPPKSGYGANPKRENARVAAAMWGGADSFEQ